MESLSHTLVVHTFVIIAIINQIFRERYKY